MTDSPKIVLTLLAQQYGLTAEDLADALGCSINDIIVEKVSCTEPTEDKTNGTDERR